MSEFWRTVMQFPDEAKLGFNEVYTRYVKLSQSTSSSEERRILADAYKAARKELGARPTDAED